MKLNPQDTIRRARKLGFQGRVSGAIGLLRSIPQDDPANSEAAALAGRICLSSGRYVDAKTFFLQAVSARPKDRAISFGYFLSLWEDGNIDNALEEIARFSEQGQAEAYDEVMKAFFDYLHEESGVTGRGGAKLSLDDPAVSKAGRGFKIASVQIVTRLIIWMDCVRNSR